MQLQNYNYNRKRYDKYDVMENSKRGDVLVGKHMNRLSCQLQMAIHVFVYVIIFRKQRHICIFIISRH